MSVDKFKSADDLRRIRDAAAGQNARLVFTNGCFDLLHVGHVRYLREARALGDFLLVALNSDASVRALKGPGRPINNAEDRAEIIAAIESVDFVTIFDEERVTDLIRAVRPQVYVKGGDYTRATLQREEVAALEEVGAEIHIVPLVAGKSTSHLVAQLRATQSAAPQADD